MRLDECLFVAVSVLLALDVLLLHLLVLLTLLLPVEFKVDVACDICDWQVLLCQFHNFLEGVLVLHSLELRVHLEVLSNNLVGDLNQALNLVAWECWCVVLLSPEDGLCDVAVLELRLMLLLFCLLAGRSL